MVAKVTIGQAEFRLAIERFKTRRKVKPREMAILGFDGRFFSIEALGLVAAMHSEGLWPGLATFPAAYIAALAKVPPKEDPVIISCDESRVHIGTLSISCSWQRMSDTLLEIPGAPDWLVLLSTKYASSRGQILAAGIQQEIDNAERKLSRLLDRAAKPLEILGITGADLRPLVEAKLRGRG